ncbi:antibiotic transporter [Spirochaetia bacterium]|nr:antibiotic transporter [Spirochaetia bacterium]
MEKFFKCPKVIVGIIALITVFCALQLPKLEMDNNNFRFIPEKHESRVISDHFEETFGNNVSILIALERPSGSVFDPEFTMLMKEYIKKVKFFEFVDDVSSLMTTDYITADGDTILVTNLVGDDFSGTQEEITLLQQRIASWDLYEGSIVSDDLTSTQIIISLDVPEADAGKPAVIATLFSIRDMAQEMFSGFADVYVSGIPVLSATISETMLHDIVYLIPLVLVVLLGVLYFSFHRASGVILPTLTVLIATIWSVGVMPLIGVKLSLISMIVPILIIAVGSAYGIHVVTHYFEEMRTRQTASGMVSREEHTEIVFNLVRRLINPVFFAALTTLAGFISFCFTPIVPMQEFGIATSIGVLVAFVLAITFIPACLLIRGPKAVKEKILAKEKMSKQVNGLEADIAKAFLGIVIKRRFILVCTVIITAVALYGSSKLVIDNVLVEYFNKNSPIAKSDRFIRENFGGTKLVSMVLEADSTEALLDPKVLTAMDELHTTLMEKEPLVGKVIGFTDMIKRTNQVFNADESPEGLRPASNGQNANDTEKFGFGDFGISYYDDDFEAASPEVSSKNADILAAQISTAELIALLDSAAGTKKGMNANTLVKELKKRTNYEGMAYYEIPGDPAKYRKTTDAELEGLIANYLALLSGDINKFSNDPLEPTAIKSKVQMRTLGNNDSAGVVNAIKQYAGNKFPDTVRFTIGGGTMLEIAMGSLIINSQIITIIFSILMIFIIIAISNKSCAAGLVGIIAIIISVLCNFAIMGFLGIKLNIGTAIIASLIVGIGIDYTIHFIDSFKREYNACKAGEDKHVFLYHTFRSSGKAIMVNAISVGGGFAVLAFSNFKIIADMGLLVALAMGVTALLSLTVIPALLLTFKPKFIYRSR